MKRLMKKRIIKLRLVAIGEKLPNFLSIFLHFVKKINKKEKIRKNS